MADTSDKQNKRHKGKLFLENVTMADFINWRNEGSNPETNRDLVFIDASASIREAVQLLHQHNILSVPVWDSANNEFIWFLSIVDILRFAMTDNDRVPQNEDVRTLRPIDALFEYKLKDMIDALGDEEAGVVQVVSKSSQVTNVMNWFTLGVHRVLVQQDGESLLNPTSNRVYIVSQSDVIRYLEAHENDMGDIGEKTLQEHGFLNPDVPSIGPNTLVTLNQSSIAIEGFGTLFAKRANAAAVVDDNGKLVDNLSVSDLRGVLASNIEHLLAQPVLQFLIQRRGARDPIACSPQTPLKQVVHILAQTRVHRLWIVDDVHHVVGVVSLTDVLCKFAPFDYKLLDSKRI